jgi:anti-sigma factor RsiW
MTCKNIEELLPAYVEGDLADADLRAVETHVHSCADCAVALEEYRAIEFLLVERTAVLSDANVTATAVVRRLGLRNVTAWGRVSRWVSVLGTMPAMVSASFITVGILLLAFRHSVSATLARLLEGFSHASGSSVVLSQAQGVTEGVGALLTASPLIAPAIYLGIFAVIVLSGSYVVLRFVRE